MENEIILTPNKIWETIYDLSYLAGEDNLVELYDNDSRELYNDIQKWAIEFEEKFNIDFDCSEFDYIIEIDKFYEEKKNEIIKSQNIKKKNISHTNVINEYWSEYNKYIAHCHILFWGTIYLDDCGYPMNINEVIYLLYL